MTTLAALVLLWLCLPGIAAAWLYLSDKRRKGAQRRAGRVLRTGARDTLRAPLRPLDVALLLLAAETLGALSHP